MGPSVNTRWWESAPSLAPDNRTLYFSSRRPGGKGGADIWVTQLNKLNKWNPPVNLGPEINTAGMEETPFIHPDSKTLYFSSDTHLGFGSHDLFVSRMNDNGEWQAPRNLGYPINDDGRQGGLFVNLSGKKAFFSSDIVLNPDDPKAGDLYSFDLPVQLRPDLVTYIQLEVRDAESNGLIIAQTQLVDLLNNDEPVSMQTDVGGKLLTTIKLGEYALNVTKQKYLFHSENIVVNSVTTAENPFHFIVRLQKIPEKEAVVVSEEEAPKIILHNIFFETGSAQLLTKSNTEIANLHQLLTVNEDMKIKILGHTDDVGSDTDNQRLSEQRAKSVFDKLVTKGISPQRMQYEGKGESEPIATNDTPDGRRQNRRTEFFIIK